MELAVGVGWLRKAGGGGSKGRGFDSDAEELVEEAGGRVDVVLDDVLGPEESGWLRKAGGGKSKEAADEAVGAEVGEVKEGGG